MKIKHKFNKDKLWFTADEHFYHNNIISYCNRPFNNIEEMNNTLITNWNELIQPDDDVIIAGDFIHSGNLILIEDILSKLNGTKWLVYGNHCYQNKFEREFVVQNLFKNRCYDAMDFTVEDEELEDGYMKFHVTHYPCLFWTRGAVHVHGHIHSGPLSTGSEVADFNPLRYDVGVDNNNMKPVSYNDLKVIITKQLLQRKSI